MHTSRKLAVVSFFILSVLSILFLAACSGRTFIDFNYNPTTGAGNVVINPPAQQPTALPETGGTGTNMSQVVLFAIVLIVLLGIVAIVASVGRRPRREE